MGMILITGSQGFIGSALIKEVDGIHYDLKGGRDIRNMSQAISCLSGVQTIVHLAANPGVQQSIDDPEDSYWHNLHGTWVMLEAARKAGVKRFIFASSGAVENRDTPYAAYKAAGEFLCEAYRKSYGINTLSMRFTNVYGPGSQEKTSVVARMCRSALTEGVITVYGDGSQTRDFIHVRDVVAAIKVAINMHICGSIYIGTGSQTTINHIAQVISKRTGGTVHYAKALKNDAKSNVVPVGQAKAWMNWKAQIPLDWGLNETINYFESSYK